jgi:hypothetical protein
MSIKPSLLSLFAGLALLGPVSPALAAPTPIAIAEFEYSDGSGEPGDQREAHARRLQDFSAALRHDLAQGGNFRIINLDCATVCSAEQANLGKLAAEARRQGAQLLLLGFIHKESTLIQWAKAVIIDLDGDKVMTDRYLSFRGDDDQSWRRAEAFLAKDLLKAPIGRAY